MWVPVHLDQEAGHRPRSVLHISINYSDQDGKNCVYLGLKKKEE